MRRIFLAIAFCLFITGCDEICNHEWEYGATGWKWKQYRSQNDDVYYPSHLFECTTCGDMAIVRCKDDMLNDIDVIIFSPDPIELSR